MGRLGKACKPGQGRRHVPVRRLVHKAGGRPQGRDGCPVQAARGGSHANDRQVQHLLIQPAIQENQQAEVNINESSGTITVHDEAKNSLLIMAMDSSSLKHHNRGEWMRVKWKVKRGFVKLHILVDTDTKKILAAEVTDDTVGDSSVFEKLLGQIVGKVSADAGNEPVSQPGSSLLTQYENHLASGTPPLESLCCGAPSQTCANPPILMADAAYGSRKNIAACAQAGIAPGMMHKINVIARGKGTGDAWDTDVRDQLSGSPEASHLELMDREEKRENQTYWKCRIDYGKRWLVESVFSVLKRVFGDYVMSLK